MIESFTSATFRDRRGETFRVSDGGSVVFDAELTEVAEAQAGPGARARTPFSLVFRGPLEPVLPQRIYGLEHAELGEFELFLVPIGPDEVGMRYEAVFT